jgi:hypothetical protein
MLTLMITPAKRLTPPPKAPYRFHSIFFTFLKLGSILEPPIASSGGERMMLTPAAGMAHLPEMRRTHVVSGHRELCERKVLALYNSWRATRLSRIFRHENKRIRPIWRSWRGEPCLAEESGVLCNRWPSDFFVSADVPSHIVAGTV